MTDGRRLRNEGTKPHQHYERILIWDCGHQVEDPDDPHCLQCGFPKYDNWAAGGVTTSEADE